MTATAAVVTAGAAVYGAYQQSKAANTSAAGSEAAANYQNAQYQQTRTDLLPWYYQGRMALNAQSQLLGLPYYDYSQPYLNPERTMLPSTQLQLGQPTTASGGTAPAYVDANGNPIPPTQLNTQPIDYTNPVVSSNPNSGNTTLISGIQYALPAPSGNTSTTTLTAPTRNTTPLGPTDTTNPYGYKLITPGMPEYNNGLSSITNTPGYQFRLDQGLKAIQRTAAARGDRYGGGTMIGLENYAQNYASNEYMNRLNELAALAGTGQTTAQNIGTFGQNAATNIGGYMQNAADARGSGYIGSARTLSSGLGSAWSMYQQGQNNNPNNSGINNPNITWY